ncbi:BQ5605_C006g03924 [Microbotryum silenes-dioicae]|uniref:BQ5605_C006g03924 protein n=1 Tax=Microbotryum silenes-dioicae TaxID=796604 RepID=A0A2X0M9L9_9BASI|nr:BQ5605_C006g03924 [Microbotryum silenes-dioicae]
MQMVKDCVPCHLGKDAAHRSHTPATHRATAPFGRVYMDLWGPGPVVSLLGHCYLCVPRLPLLYVGERHEIALEPHWFRVQTERIKRCNSQAKKDYSKD